MLSSRFSTSWKVSRMICCCASSGCGRRQGLSAAPRPRGQDTPHPHPHAGGPQGRGWDPPTPGTRGHRQGSWAPNTPPPRAGPHQALVEAGEPRPPVAVEHEDRVDHRATAGPRRTAAGRAQPEVRPEAEAAASPSPPPGNRGPSGRFRALWRPLAAAGCVRPAPPRPPQGASPQQGPAGWGAQAPGTGVPPRAMHRAPSTA